MIVDSLNWNLLVYISDGLLSRLSGRRAPCMTHRRVDWSALNVWQTANTPERTDMAFEGDVDPQSAWKGFPHKKVARRTQLWLRVVLFWPYLFPPTTDFDDRTTKTKLLTAAMHWSLLGRHLKDLLVHCKFLTLWRHTLWRVGNGHVRTVSYLGYGLLLERTGCLTAQSSPHSHSVQLNSSSLLPVIMAGASERGFQITKKRKKKD